VLQRNIKRVRDPIQANARGAALIASAGLGSITFDDIPGLTEYDGEFSPDSTNVPVYEGLFKEFTNIYRKNHSIFDRLNAQ